MRDLRAIVAAYEQLDTHLEELRGAADANEEVRDRIAQRQRINDHAYFVLAWGQFESSVEDSCREAIRRGQAQRDWKSSRACSLYDPDDRRLSGLRFEDRLALVLEKGSEFWKRAIQHYNVRNQVAHGTLRSERIDVSSVVQEFYLIQSSLTRS